MNSIVHTKILTARDRYRTNLQVLRGIATLEVTKGMIVLLAAVGILLVVRREDPWDIADGLLRLLHISPDHHFAQVFLDWAELSHHRKTMDSRRRRPRLFRTALRRSLRTLVRPSLGRVDRPDFRHSVSPL